MRICVHCRRSIAGYRRQARFCSGACRAAASRARAARRAESRDYSPVAEKPHRNRTPPNRADSSYHAATPAEEARIARLLRRHADLLADAEADGAAA